MKRFVYIILLLALLLLPSGCGLTEPDTDRLQVVCTVFPQYDFLRSIAGDKVDVKMLVPLGTESHDFSLENLTMAELKSVSTADLVVYVGGESDESWISELRSAVTDNGTRWMAMTDMTATLEEVMTESMEHGHDHDHDHDHDEEHHVGNAYDEHVWTSPKRAVDIVKALTDALCELDNKNAAEYRLNCDAYVAELQVLDLALADAVSDAQGRKLIFGDRFPFRYLCTDYGLEFDAAFPGCSANSDPSVSQIISLTESAVDSKAKIIFYMENSEPVYARNIAKTVGGKAMLLHSCHTLTRSELDSGNTYLSLMSDNIEKIAEAFE